MAFSLKLYSSLRKIPGVCNCLTMAMLKLFCLNCLTFIALNIEQSLTISRIPLLKFFLYLMKRKWWLPAMLTGAVLVAGAGIKRQWASMAAIAPASDSLVLYTENRAQLLYDKLGLATQGLSREVFETALTGYYRLKEKGAVSKSTLAIADMGQPSKQKRLYIIDLEAARILFHTYVAHGRNSGLEMATDFSNKPSSLQTSLGFYIAGSTYTGNNGYSMRLKGMEPGINDAAENRAIVMHGAPYVNERLAKTTGRIGRSWGCPAVPPELHYQIIGRLSNGSCLFIYAPNNVYLQHSKLLKQG